ncbi:MAG: DNA polymerase IV [Candidatus Curtissbacteria bacterium]|nr:DNA polymerase IV [Candidatus Curtissbacteria bacterium]
MNNKRIILHVDLNSFFATAEQQTNPMLRGKPIGITKAQGRTCIIAASVEAKRAGVSGGTTYEAKKICPEITFIPADFSKYADITYRFIDICKTYTPLCEIFSLDECFLDVTETEKFWPRPPRNASLEQIAWYEMGEASRDDAGGGNAFNIASEIKDRIRSDIGDYMSCSIGVSNSRIFAKLASGQIKPDGLFWINEDNIRDILDKSQLMDICGLGYGLHRHLQTLGINSFPELRTKSMEFLYKNFGPFWSVHLYNISRGVDTSPVVPLNALEDAKSIGRTYTTHKTLTSKTEILKLVRNLCEEAAGKARKMGLSGRYVGLMLRGGSRDPDKNQGWLASRNWEKSWYGHRTLKEYLDDGDKFFKIVTNIFNQWDIPSVRFCGVTLGMLTKTKNLTLPLFPQDRKKQRLTLATDKVNERWGEYTLFPGQLLGMPLIMPEVNGYFGDRKYRLDFLRKA